MKVLVTGGGGFLGKSICKMLLKENFEVISLSRHEYIELTELGVSQVKQDLSKLTLDTELPKFDAVIHTAALAGVWGKKEDFYNINFVGTKNLVDYCKHHKVKHFVYTSSPSVVFGADDINGADESIPYPEKFYTHYQETKKLAEEYVLTNVDSDFHALSIRPHLIWGPGDPHLFPRILARARAGKLKRVGSGENLVDIIYVDNAASAHVKALKAMKENPALSGNSYFVGQEKPVNLWDFLGDVFHRAKIEPLEDAISFKAAYNIGFVMEKVFGLLGVYQPEPPMTRFVAMQLAKSHYFSHEKAKRDFGYQAEVSIEEGLERYFRD